MLVPSRNPERFIFMPKEACLSYRNAVTADVRSLYLLQKTIYAEDYWFVGDAAASMASIAERIESLEPEQARYLVASLGDSICGWLEIQRLRAKKLEHVASLTLAVGQAFRRQGIASNLLELAYDWSRQVGVNKLSLNVRAGNYAAIALYQKQGFMLEGVEKAHIKLAKGYEDNWIMAKFLKDLDRDS